MGIGNKTSKEIDCKVAWTAVTSVFNLRDVLELIGNGLDDEALTQEESVRQQHQLTFHVPAQRGDEF